MQTVVGSYAYAVNRIDFTVTGTGEFNQTERKRDRHGTPPQSAVGYGATGKTSKRSRRLCRWQTNTASGTCDTRNTET